ncbi:DUF6221 family protein [Geodermatophilus sp. CPCC 205506]|uniref:DUF6221 family protein n=1 Tax=Geodermatophilus sp. CPCC 205506 TaxID=2936596 RepID=UPI003EEC5102
MSALADFLLARIAEDEAIAVQLAELWAKVTDADRATLDPGVREGIDSVFAVADGAPADGVPDRLLAECDAKRRIVAGYRGWEERLSATPGSDPLRRELHAAWAATGDVLRLLALPYAAHSQYREEWRP